MDGIERKFLYIREKPIARVKRLKYFDTGIQSFFFLGEKITQDFCHKFLCSVFILKYTTMSVALYVDLCLDANPQICAINNRPEAPERFINTNL